MSRIDIDIGVLRVTGTTGHRASALSRDLGAELQQLLSAGGVPRAWITGRADDRVRGMLPRGAAGAAVTEAAARAIYRGSGDGEATR